jgi:hypothetical protein
MLNKLCEMLCERSGKSTYDLCKAGFVWLKIVTAQIALKISSVKFCLRVIYRICLIVKCVIIIFKTV